MARLIFICPYMKPEGNAVRRANLIRYMATREGSVPVYRSTSGKPATKKQKELIAHLAAQLPESTELFEYKDYLHRPTVGTASAYIVAAAEYEYVSTAGRGQFLSYMAERPGVKARGAHGLFGSEDNIALAHAMEEVANHQGNIWTPVISLRREDAVKLSYDTPESWQALLRSHAHSIAKAMKIHPDNFKWYAAFHDEGQHPHIHMVCFSADPKEGFLTVQGIREIKKILVTDIFRQELETAYQQQTQNRDETASVFQQTLARLSETMQAGTLQNNVITDTMQQLVHKMQFHSGRKVYGYLRPPLKELVDSIVDELAKDAQIAEAYTAWCENTQRIAAAYGGETIQILPLSQQKEFKHIRNMVVAEAVALIEGKVLVEESATVDAEAPEPEQDTPADYEVPESAGAPPTRTSRKKKQSNGWTEEYKAARLYLYGNKEQEPDLPKALQAMTAEAQKGNALAMHDLGCMYADGLGCEVDAEKSFAWYEKALLAFFRWEKAEENKYIEYRIGKMYAYGLGCEVDEEYAVQWFTKSATQDYKYAQYSLACCYRDGKGVEKNLVTAFGLFAKAADQSFPYASFELGKMCRDGTGTPQDAEASAQHFQIAFAGFVQMAETLSDDKLQYRIGWMLLTGTGTEKDEKQAEEYFIKAAKLGNLHAKYQLAKLYVAREDIDPTVFQQAVEWMREAAEDGNDAAQYALGKLYIEKESIYNPLTAAYWLSTASTAGNQFAQYRLGKLLLEGLHLPLDIRQGRYWLEASAAQENQYAMHLLGKSHLDERFQPPDIGQARAWFERAALLGYDQSMYQLGKTYLQGEPMDTAQAVHWLAQAAGLGNQFAQYALGKVSLFGDEAFRDEAAAKEMFTLAAEQGNIYAQYMLQHMEDWRHGQAMLASTRLLMGIGKLFQSKTAPAGAWRGHSMDHKREQQLRRRDKARNGGQAMLDEEIQEQKM